MRRQPAYQRSIRSSRLPPARCGPCVVAIGDVAELERYAPAWEDLAAAALEPNVFYEHWMLLPAVRAFGAGRRLVFVLVFDGPAAPAAEPSRLLGVFPFERGCSYPWLPVRTLRLWKYQHCYLNVPLIRAEAAADCLAALFAWLASDSQGAALVEFPEVTVEGPFHALLSDYLAEQGRQMFTRNTFRRALLRPQTGKRPRAEDVLSGGRRKSLRSKQRRLAEHGPVTYVPLEHPGDVEAWIDDFLRCEASGWKGCAGTALACSAADRAYFRAVVTAAWQRGRLVALTLDCGGRPIALRCTLLAREGAFAFKTAHDEAYARYAPGVLLEAETMFQLHTLPGVEWVDSCTAPDNFLLNRLWPERRVIQTVLVSTGKRLGDLAIDALTGLRRVKRRFASLRRSSTPSNDQRKPLDDEPSRRADNAHGA